MCELVHTAAFLSFAIGGIHRGGMGLNANKRPFDRHRSQTEGLAAIGFRLEPSIANRAASTATKNDAHVILHLTTSRFFRNLSVLRIVLCCPQEQRLTCGSKMSLSAPEP
jgi:hypothetical protein